MKKIWGIEIHNKRQQGFVAIFSVLIIMGILALLVIGFSNITRQAQRRTLDDHLSSQAFYAAESGVSVAEEYLAGQDLSTFANKTDCLGGGHDGNFVEDMYKVDEDRGITITCLTIDVNPGDLEYSAIPVVGSGEPVVSFVKFNAGTVDSLNFEWDSPQDKEGIGNHNRPSLLSYGEWGNDVGMIRVDLVPANTFERSQLVNRTRTFYLYPTLNTSAGTTHQATGGVNNQGEVFLNTCSNDINEAYRCKATVGIPGGEDAYYMRVQSYYQQTKVRVASSNPTARMTGGQAVIDSTGRANDVYRRIQVRIPISPDNSYSQGLHEPFALLTSGSICKLLLGVPAPGESSFENPHSDPSCDIET